MSEPAVAGFDPARLAALAAMLRAHCADGRLPGAVALLARPQGTWQGVFGHRDLARGAALRPDSLFDVASMTKPLLAVATLLLVEEGRLALDAPVGRWLPELAAPQVLRHPGGALDDTVPAARAITVEDLLTLRLGTGALFEPSPLREAMSAAGVGPGADRPRLDPDEWLRRLGALPLAAQPGQRWLYHTGFDVLAVLLRRVAGRSLEALLRDRVFGPLGMADSHFTVPAEKRERVATRYRLAEGRLEPVADLTDPAGPIPFESEIWSTAADFLAFGRFLLSGVAADGRRLLAPGSLAAMTRDQIPAEVKARSPFFPGFWDEHGWGYGLALVHDGAGRVRRFGWDGGFGTSFYCAPASGLVGLLLTQRAFDPEMIALLGDFWRLAEASPA